MRKIAILSLLCFSSLMLTSCSSFFSNDKDEEDDLPSIGEWAEAGNYKFRVLSIENTKKIKSSISDYVTQNNYMCILVELKNDSKYSHKFLYSDFKVYKDEIKYESKGTEAYYYAESKGDFPSLYLSNSIEPTLGGKYYLVYETPTTSLDGNYELEYNVGDKARVKLSGGEEGDVDVVPTGKVTFEQLEDLASKAPKHSYTRASVTGTVTSTNGSEHTSHSYTETWTCVDYYWSLSYAYPEEGGVNLNHTELSYFIDYLTNSQKECCEASVDPFKIVSKNMDSVMYYTLKENATYIWNEYGLIKSISMNLYNPSNTSATATWNMSATYYSY